MDGCRIFREELAISHPTHGYALWEPDPGGQYETVEVGDVGFIRSGYFLKLFNALSPPDASDGPKYPPKLQLRGPRHTSIRKVRDGQQDFCSHNVEKQVEETKASG